MKKAIKTALFITFLTTAAPAVADVEEKLERLIELTSILDRAAKITSVIFFNPGVNSLQLLQDSQQLSTEKITERMSELADNFNSAIESATTAMNVDDLINIQLGFRHTQSNAQYTLENRATALLLPPHDRRFRQKIEVLKPFVANPCALTPPPAALDGLNDEYLTQIDDYARLLSLETATAPAPTNKLYTSAATEYELERISYIQKQLLAQEAIKQYPLHSDILRAYSDRQIQISKQASNDNTNAATLQALSTLASVNKEEVSRSLLESSLRTERLYGTLLAIEAERQLNKKTGAESAVMQHR